ncbi:MAG: glycogen-binding domain-containing protein [bacterium]
MTQSAKKGKKHVHLSIKAEENNEVSVAGSFNEWNPKKHKLTYADGVYTISLLLGPGRHEYKFVINDVWCIDPECVEWAPNGLGSLNSVIVVE